MNDIIRVRFTRGDEVKYISHLDMMKAFERALRRCAIPIAYSQGFNPHPQMVFGLPLSVGVTSECEYADFELSTELNPEDLMERLNGVLPKGIRIIEAKHKKTKTNIMATIIAASYEVLVHLEKDTAIEKFTEKIKEFLSKSSIIIKKESKNGAKDVDIRPMIQSLEPKAVQNDIAAEQVSNKHICSNISILEYLDKLKDNKQIYSEKLNKNILCISMVLSAGSNANLKPELLIAALNEELDLGLRSLKIHRTGLFVGKNDAYINPLSSDALLSL